MAAQILDGRQLAARLREQLAEDVIEFIENNGATPTLAAVLVGNDPASEAYVRHKRADCERAGIVSRLHRLEDSASQEELLKLLAKLNKDDEVHGILVQLPLPPEMDPHRIHQAISPRKDVDGFHPENVGLLVQGRPRFVPCTPAGICALLDHHGVELAGRHVVVLGRSDIVGKPLASLLLQKHPRRNATVTVCHSQSRDLSRLTREADVVVAAIGQPRLVTGEMIRPGAVVVDVGINRQGSNLVGDVDMASVREVAGWVSPVPGGVGPLTRAMLLWNTLLAARGLET